MSVTMEEVHTIPVYKGMTPEQSWATIVLADGKEVDSSIAGAPVEGWANIGIWRNSLGESFAAPLSLDHDEPVGILMGYDDVDELQFGDE